MMDIMFDNYFYDGDYIVFYRENGNRYLIQSERTRELAERATNNLNEHERRNGRPEVWEFALRA